MWTGPIVHSVSVSKHKKLSLNPPVPEKAGHAFLFPELGRKRQADT